MTFLGMTGSSSDWVSEYAALVAPTEKHDEGGGPQGTKSQTDVDGGGRRGLQRHQTDLAAGFSPWPCQTMREPSICMSQADWTTAMLTQSSRVEGRKQPIANYSLALSAVELALPPCYQGLVAVHLMHDKASTLKMGHKVKIHTHTGRTFFVERWKFVLTEPRVGAYLTLLQHPDVSIATCTTANPC